MRDEAGYSLVELLVAIMLLSIAIIPMVGMFDMGLRAATTSRQYDQARALANSKLEEVRSLPFADADGLPDATQDSLLERYKPSNEPAPPVGLGPGPAAGYPCNDSRFPDCRIFTTYVSETRDATSGEDYAALPSAANSKTFFVRVVVRVEFDNGAFTTTGLKTREI